MDWVELMQRIVHGGGTHLPADSIAWDRFYLDYRDAKPELRKEIDDAFLACSRSDDVEVLDAVISHCHDATSAFALPVLFRLLEERGAFLAQHTASGGQHSLLARVLNAMGAQAGEQKARVLEALLAWAPRAGPLHRGVGSFVGTLGPEALAALVAVLPEGAHGAGLAEAGSELHRDESVWARALIVSAGWPLPLREALLRGGQQHAEFMASLGR